jgi:hypothetical protein
VNGSKWSGIYPHTLPTNAVSGTELGYATVEHDPLRIMHAAPTQHRQREAAEQKTPIRTERTESVHRHWFLLFAKWSNEFTGTTLAASCHLKSLSYLHEIEVSILAVSLHLWVNEPHVYHGLEYPAT